MKKRTFYTEFAYILGLCAVAFGVMLTVTADFGVSMIVAPAYILYEWINPVWSFFTFGMAARKCAALSRQKCFLTK